MEFAWSLPETLKRRDGLSKWILRQVLYRHVPPALIDRPKMGFGVPILEWLRTDLSEYARELVLDGEASRLFLDPVYLGRLWNEHQRGLKNWSTELWVVMILNLWFNRFAVKSGAATIP